MAHHKSPTISEKAGTMMKKAGELLTGKASSGELRGIAAQIESRVRQIDNRLAEIAPPRNGERRGGPVYEAALGEDTPDALAALHDEQVLLQAERQQLGRRAGEIRDAKQRAEVREAFAHVKELDGLCDQAEQALAAYNKAVRRLNDKKSRIAIARNVGDRIHEPVPQASPELAVRCARLLASDARNMNGARVACLKDLGVSPVTRHLVAEAGKAPGEPVQVEAPDKAAAAELKSELKSAVNE